jgi:hypothetical protein
MIRTALEFIQKELEAYIIDREQDPAEYANGQVVDIKSVVLPNGNMNVNEIYHITMMLVGIEEERRESKRPRYVQREDNQLLRLNPPLEIDVYLLFAAHKEDYPTALRDLTDVLAFFQANNVFDEQKYPSLNASVEHPVQKPWQLIDKLIFNLHSFSFEQQNNLWAMLGAKYIPSVVYKMKMLTLFDTRSKELSAPVTEFGQRNN